MENHYLKTLDQLDELEELLLEGSRIPFCSSRLVNEHEAYDLIEQIRASIPQEITKARHIINSKEDCIKQGRIKAEILLKDAINEREQILNSHEIKLQAEKIAQDIKRKAQLEHERIISDAKQRSNNVDRRISSELIQQEKHFKARKQKVKRELINLQRQLNNKYSQRIKRFRLELENLRQAKLKLANTFISYQADTKKRNT